MAKMRPVHCPNFQAGLLVFLFWITGSLQAQFTAGRLVVLQAGDGNLPLSSNGNVILFKEYSTNGAPGYSMTVPSTGTNALIIRGSAISEGHISLSEDASCVVFGAYAQSLPFSSPLNSPAASTLNRGIGLLFSNGSYSLGAIGASPFANGDIRGATANSSLNLWASSSSAGASYYGAASAQGNVQNTKANLRAIHVFNQQLFVSSQSAAGSPSVIGIFSVGSGTPVSSNQAVNLVINTGANSQPCQFYFNVANTICYVADSRNSSQGGIQKWLYSAGSWSLVYTLSTGSGAAGAQGVVADFSGSFPKVYATTSEASSNRLIAINDLGPTSTATTLATASMANTIFRGLCFSPGTLPCNSPVILSITGNSAQCAGDTLVFTPNVAGNTPLSYTWSGPGVFSSSTAASPSIVLTTSGQYTLSVANSCGTSSAVTTITVMPSPILQVNAPTICSGGTATLNASGALSYTWNNGNNTPNITVNPTITTNYTVIGTSNLACISAPVTTTVFVTSSLSLTVNSATLCASSSATLNVSGASTYTWSTLQNSQSIVVTPLSSLNYTVYGSAPGCPNTATAYATVLVNALPQVSIISPDTLVCETEVLFSFQGDPSGGTFIGTGMNGNLFSPTQAGVGSHHIYYYYTDSNGCSNSDSITVQVDACNTLSEDKFVTPVLISPNPTQGLVQIYSGKTIHEILLFDVFGHLLLKEEPDRFQTELDLSPFSSGLYFLKITFPGRCRILRLIRN